ncbi:MAG: tRNA (adenosine(37)-N6)-threonylcarbamoyltransferase complex ATPase subunit type 1 TsaE [Candidatus Nealsonbacteria bacterium]|nr:tRNA (adenosine(37)-N6)-threonylcarbamoyltransferase complex ATPase subunit type 1 TsaE [Candidatus Nealsonbacteria bacterium]
MLISKSTEETQKIAKLLAKKILKFPPRGAAVLALVGNLGSGKTCFLQGFARGLGIKEKINSPTFVIMKRFKNFYHFDCYRISKSKDILDLGFKNILENTKNIVAIEWADKIKKIIPKDARWIKFEILGQNKRKIVIE